MKKVKILLPILFLIILIFLIPSIKANTYLWENSTWNNSLVASIYPSQVWGDLDDNGFLDLILIGDTSGGKVAKIYINNGTGLIDNSTWSANLTGVHYGSIALGDIDNDGDLDLVLTGCSGGGSYTTSCDDNAEKSFVYINNGISLVENSTWKGDMADVWKGSIALGDINNDGKLDLVLTGQTTTSIISKVYINNGTGFAENLAWQSSLSAIDASAVVLGDIDNDNDLDLIISGEDSGNTKHTEVYLNNGSSFARNTTWDTNLVAVGDSSLALGDFDSNGYLDLTLIGCCDKHRTYNNTGTAFSEVQAESGNNQDLGGIFAGSISLGDYDNDGDLDMLTSGREGYTFVYLGNNSGLFTEYIDDPESDILDVYYSSVIWVDLENDSDLDVSLFGYGGGGGGWYQIRVYINNISSNNTPPNASTSFTSSYVNNKLTLTWNNGSDENTSTLGLYYNLRVGTTSGGHEVVSGVYGGGDDNGYFGNMMQRKSITLNSLNLVANQTIYWAVQTIDTGLAKSSWSAEQNFILPLDITDPVITLNAPIDGFNTSSFIITFNATVYDNMNLTNVNLYGNWSGSLVLNETNSSGINNTDYIFTKNLTSYGDGVYTWLIEARDETNNSINSSLRTFRIDTTSPIIKLSSPTNASTWTSSSTVTFTYNVTDVAIKNCSLIIDNAIDQSDTSVFVNIDQTFTKSLSNAVYNWSVNCTDHVGFQNNSETRQLTVSYTPPNTLRGSISSTILRNGLAIFLAIFILVVLITPLFIVTSKEKEWTTNQWIIYFISGIITVFMIIILIKEIFNVTA